VSQIALILRERLLHLLVEFAPPNSCQELAAGRSPRRPLKRLDPAKTHGVTPLAGQGAVFRPYSRQAARRKSRSHAGPRAAAQTIDVRRTTMDLPKCDA
jgi:hypothetical protein